MNIRADHADDEARLIRVAERMIEERGDAISIGSLATLAGMPRARVEAIFADESALFDAIVERWFVDHTAIMEDVLASDLPPNRKMYEFFALRFRLNRERYRANPAAFKAYCELGAAQFERIRGYVDLADHYLCELIAQAQAEGAFDGLAIDRALSLINQMVLPYTLAEVLIFMDERLSEEKLGQIVDTLFAGLSAADGGARGVSGLRAA
ncbi:TetR/AcrR family transcriptional regulator [Parafrankia sp. BMG5.11]|uniref:TetR/AcrR family transcriptional regulator n=1 Tax=Parafrankia sp. BMG5.11 TaxID=222540 RepID=UPI0010390263|nr:TetR/AcrR family transcriptional regulator [Parafrankia sp. BMG5.11]TCJ39841.1 TetR/AcrR family transcriptional regulator [Parafrankia sp. BMG5.11]